MKFRALCGLVLAVTTCSLSARAEDDAASRARVHFETGLRHLDKGEYEPALAEFRAAQTFSDSPKIVLNIATTLRQLGRLAEAANAYARYLEHPAKDDARALEVERVLSELDGRLGRLQISATSGSTVAVDGTRLELGPRLSTIHRVHPGSHTVTASKPDHIPANLSVDVAAGEQRTVELNPVAKSVPGPDVDNGAPSSSEPPIRDRGPIQGPTEKRAVDGIGAFVRADIDGKARGARIAPGISYAVGRHVELGAAALIGRHQGAWAGARGFILTGAVKPSILVGAPIFFIDGVRPGIHGATGLVWDPNPHFGFSLDIGVAHFFSVPATYAATYFLPSLGLRARL